MAGTNKLDPGAATGTCSRDLLLERADETCYRNLLSKSAATASHRNLLPEPATGTSGNLLLGPPTGICNRTLLPEPATGTAAQCFEFCFGVLCFGRAFRPPSLPGLVRANVFKRQRSFRSKRQPHEHDILKSMA